MPKLLLVYPLYTNDKLDRNARTIYPLALSYLAAYAPDHWDVSVIDEQFEDIDYQNTCADVVGITTTTLTANRAYDIATKFRAKGITVFLGGVHASTVPEEAIQYCDALCIGDGEEMFPKMLADFENGCLQKTYKGSLASLAGLKRPRHELFKDKYSFIPVSTSRGCPFNCSFCCINEFYEGAYRSRPVEDVIEEMKTLPKGYDIVFVTDGNMFGYSRKETKRFKELCKRIIEEHQKGTLPFKYFTCYGSINALDDIEALDLAAAAGCAAILVGFESINPEALKSMNKTLNLKYGVDSYKQLVDNAQQRGILIVGEMIVGNDADDAKSLEETRKFLREINFDVLRLQIMQPLPGTQLFNQLKNAGRLHIKNFPKDWDQLRDGFVVGVAFDLHQLETTQLQRWVKDTGLEFFSYPKIANRAYKCLKRTHNARMAGTIVAMSLRSRKTYANLDIPQ